MADAGQEGQEHAPDERLEGTFVKDTKRSDSMEPFFELVGVPWLIRKMIGKKRATLVNRFYTNDAGARGFETCNMARKDHPQRGIFNEPTPWQPPMGDAVNVVMSVLEGGRVRLTCPAPRGKTFRIVSTFGLEEGGDVLAQFMECHHTETGERLCAIRGFFQRKA